MLCSCALFLGLEYCGISVISTVAVAPCFFGYVRAVRLTALGIEDKLQPYYIAEQGWLECQCRILFHHTNVQHLLVRRRCRCFNVFSFALRSFVTLVQLLLCFECEPSAALTAARQHTLSQRHYFGSNVKVLATSFFVQGPFFSFPRWSSRPRPTSMRLSRLA